MAAQIIPKTAEQQTAWERHLAMVAKNKAAAEAKAAAEKARPLEPYTHDPHDPQDDHVGWGLGGD